MTFNTELWNGQAPEAGGYAIERSVRFNSADSAYLNRTPASAGNRKTWTWSGWLKRSTLGTSQLLFYVRQDSSNIFKVEFTTSDTIIFEGKVAGSNALLGTTSRVFRDASAWYHITFSLNASSTAFTVYVNGVEETLTSVTGPSNQDYIVNSTAPHYIGGWTTQFNCGLYLADIHFIDGQALDHTSFGEFDDNGVWQPIEYTGTYGTNGFHLDFSDNSTAAALGTDTSGNGNDWTVNNIAIGSAADYTRDIDLINGDPIRAINDIYDIFDGSTSTGAETDNGLGNSLLFDFANGSGSIPVSSNIQVWVGGGDGRTLKVNGSTIAVNTGTSNNPHTITGQSQLDSVEVVSEASNRSGYLLQISVDGSPLISYDPKNDDSLVDTPTNGSQTDTGVGGEVVGNYCTLNPLDKDSDCTLTNGNLDANIPNASAGAVRGTFGMSSGKWYYEFLVGSTPSIIGVANAAATLTDYPGGDANGWGVFGFNGYKYNGGYAAYGDTWTTNDLIGVAIDMDNGKIWWAKNGTWQASGNPEAGTNAAFTNLTGTVFPAAGAPANTSYGLDGSFNFGQRPFAYTAPSGFKALCTANLDDPTIADGSTAFDAVIYSGDGTNGRDIVINHSTDFVWIKARNQIDGHSLFDIVRGANKTLKSNNTVAEFDESATYGDAVSSFNSNGFTIGANNNAAQVNQSGFTFVAWSWDAGSSTVSNTDGSITSTVRANPTAGFSIVSYTASGTAGATVGHGLGVAPQFIIAKDRDYAQNWLVYHVFIGGSGGLSINLNSAAYTSDSGYWNNTNPTSSLITLGSYHGSAGTHDMIAYCFAPVDGYSAMGQFQGNGLSDGPYIYLGFKPRFFLYKRADAASDWWMFDSARKNFNPTSPYLFPNKSDAEGDGNNWWDFLSNGVKMRDRTDSNTNNASGTYIYAAFAENPFKYARAR